MSGTGLAEESVYDRSGGEGIKMAFLRLQDVRADWFSLERLLGINHGCAGNTREGATFAAI